MSEQPLSRDLATIMESLGRTLGAKKAATTPEPPGGKVIQLPLWPEPMRGIPNPVVRSALFPAIPPNKRRFLDGELLASVDGIEIRFKGKQLTQKHFDTWLQAVHLAHYHPLGAECVFTAYAFLKAQGLPASKEHYDRLQAELTDLLQPAIITYKGKTYAGGLLFRVRKDEFTRRYSLLLDPDIIKLFAPHDYTILDWEQRRRLGSKYLAKWLHSFYASHAKPLRYSVAKLRELSGSKAKSLRHFREKLRRALDELKNIGAIEAWSIEKNDLVHVRRGKAISASQRRHLTHAGPRRKTENGTRLPSGSDTTSERQ
jgi:TrfA protein